jgi:hypothetical protein
MITKFKIFEAKMRDLLNISHKSDASINRDFEYDTDLISSVYLENFDKTIHLSWNHVEKDHDMYLKVKDRTSYNSISEFNEEFQKIINDLFDNYFYKITNKKIFYDLYLTESDFHILTIIKYDNLFEDCAEIKIVTILPNPPAEKYRTIKLEY